MNEDHEGNGGGSPSAPWDDPALYVRLRQEQGRNRYRDEGRHATSSNLTRDALVGFRWFGVSFRWYCGVGGLVVGH